MSAHARVVGALMRRALHEVLRVPGAAIPGMLAPTIFGIGLLGVFGRAVELPGFPTDEFLSFFIAVGFMQGAGFAGAATGANLARDIEQGWFDRLLLAPVPRPVLLLGIVLSAAFRSLLPAGVLLATCLIIGIPWPGVGAILLGLVLMLGFAAVTACWGVASALRFRSQQAGPLIQASVLASVLFTTAYAPQELLTGWLAEVAPLNPVTRVIEGARQGFIGAVTWGRTWPALLALLGMGLALGTMALRRLARFGV